MSLINYSIRPCFNSIEQPVLCESQSFHSKIYLLHLVIIPSDSGGNYYFVCLFLRPGGNDVVFSQGVKKNHFSVKSFVFWFPCFLLISPSFFLLLGRNITGYFCLILVVFWASWYIGEILFPPQGLNRCCVRARPCFVFFAVFGGLK